ncbi:MAG: hypothetical protein ACMG6E_03905 [Candidatus Roizmanbacteria bacterium]
MQELINKNILNYTCGMQLDPNTIIDDDDEIPLQSSDIGQCVDK